MAKDDTVITISRSGRRRFIRAGSAFLIAGASVAKAQEEGSSGRSDCDGVGNAGNKNTEAAKTDSDTGATSDRQGCGRNIPITYRNETKKPVV